MSASRKPNVVECREIARMTEKLGWNDGKGYKHRYVYQVVVEGIRSNEAIEELAKTYLQEKDGLLTQAVKRTAAQFEKLNVA